MNKEDMSPGKDNRIFIHNDRRDKDQIMIEIVERVQEELSLTLHHLKLL